MKRYSHTRLMTIQSERPCAAAAGVLVDTTDSSATILLRHDGELADVRQLLEELEASFIERIGVDHRNEDPAEWDIIVASPHRIPPLPPTSAARARPRLIAVLEGDSRTLRAHLQRMAVDMIVRRPVHPTALRLLILHTLYRGPERRRRRRVSIGAEIRFRSRLLPRGGTLTDLSLRACRVLTRRPAATGKKVQLTIPARVSCGKSLRLTGTVLRCGPAPGEPLGVWLMAVGFGNATRKRSQRLERIIENHLDGPAVLRRAHRSTCGDAGSKSLDTPHEPELDPAQLDDAPTAEEDSRNEASGERRCTERHSYAQRVVALGDRATRVLLGRDISLGGMRVDPDAALDIGDRLRLAVHAEGEPLVVCARVLRDDGAKGLVLHFDDLGESESEALGKLIGHLPVLTTGPAEAGKGESGVLISEILDRQAG